MVKKLIQICKDIDVTVPNLKRSYNSRYIRLIVYFLIIDTNRDISPVVHPSSESKTYVYDLSS